MRAKLALSLALLPLAGLLATTDLSGRSLPVQPPTTLEMKDMTWEQVQGVVAGGATTVIVPTGGIEQNGPHMVLAKHDYIVADAARRIAGELGRTVVAPVVSYVPEGDWDPGTGNLQFPGTIGISEAAFDGVLDGIARSLKNSGFKLICFIGDHGQSQSVQKTVAERLTKAWEKAGVRVVHIDAYYDDKEQMQRLLADGETAKTIGDHAGIIDTSELLAVQPAGVDLAKDRRPGFTIPLLSRGTGASGEPSRSSPARGKWLIDLRINAAVRQIRGML